MCMYEGVRSVCVCACVCVCVGVVRVRYETIDTQCGRLVQLQQPKQIGAVFAITRCIETESAKV